MYDWKRYPCAVRADYQMLVDGAPNGIWIRSCGHPTALRPYCIQMADGMELERKYAHLEDAKRAAILAVEGEIGADGKPQMYIPGTEHVPLNELAQRKACEPLRARKPQKACDHGLFGDEANQSDLFARGK